MKRLEPPKSIIRKLVSAEAELNKEVLALTSRLKKKEDKPGRLNLLFPLYFGFGLRLKVILKIRLNLVKLSSRTLNVTTKIFSRWWQEAVALLFIVALVSSGILVVKYGEGTLGASFGWQQTDWSLGATDTVPAHGGGAWEYYSTSSAGLAAGDTLYLEPATENSTTQDTSVVFEGGTFDVASTSGDRVFAHALKIRGEVCSENSECFSGYCVDGVCCNIDCTDTCKECDLAGSVGTCSFVPADNQGRGCVNDCYACNGSGVCIVKTTNWGVSLYNCSGANSRCYSGVCRTCERDVKSDGCSGCAGQGGNVCWVTGTNVSCNTTCSSRGGCVAANWNYLPDCSNSPWQGIPCGFRSSSYAPTYWFLSGSFENERRGTGYSQNCGLGTGYGNVYRACVCAY